MLQKRKEAYQFIIEGQVQGVGFRPSVVRIAKELNLTGFVRNIVSGVEIQVQGTKKDVNQFEKLLLKKKPKLSKINKISKIKLKTSLKFIDFQILQSSSEINNSVFSNLILPDVKICDDCLKEFSSPKSRFFNYFLTSCTNCGARFSLINLLPYDRKNSAMSKFQLCKNCKNDFDNLENKRFHHQLISCPDCTPKLRLLLQDKLYSKTDVFQKIGELLNNKKIGAVKGIGGFNLICDATSDEVVLRLRKIKNRYKKPFAVMFPNIQTVKKILKTSEFDEKILNSQEAPIVILELKNLKQQFLSKFVAPDLNRIGAILSYSAHHLLIFKYFAKPIIFTSANLSGEPLIDNFEELKSKFNELDFILDFDRDIFNSVDDSLVLPLNSSEKLILRLGRGFAPKVLKYPNNSKNRDKKILAVGGHQKNSIALFYQDTIILSQFIGDLENYSTFQRFEKTISNFKKLFNFEPEIILSDKHPKYLSTQWAELTNLPIFQIQHHLAHIYSVVVEHNLTNNNFIGFAFDGTGFGEDKTIWGGEIFDKNKRIYYFKTFQLLGGEKAVKEPKRVAIAILFEYFSFDEVVKIVKDKQIPFSKKELELLYKIWQKNISVKTSSVGRLFDAIASLSGICHIQNYEGEAGTLTEIFYNPEIKDNFNFKIDKNGKIEILFDFFDKDLISRFINTIAEIIFQIAKKHKKTVILSGGVFQNKTLLNLILEKLKQENIKTYFNSEIPINDGGLAVGQIGYFLNNF